MGGKRVNMTTKEKRQNKIEKTIAYYHHYWKDMKHAVSRFYLTAIRSKQPEEMDSYVEEINEIAYGMQLPESRLFAYALIELKDSIKARKTEWLKAKATKTKLYEIKMSEEEYKAVLDFLKGMRAE